MISEMDDDAAKISAPFWEKPCEQFGPRLEAVVDGEFLFLCFAAEWCIAGADQEDGVFAIAPYLNALYCPDVGVSGAALNDFFLVELLVVFRAHSRGHVDELAGLPALRLWPAVASTDGVDFGRVVVEILWAGGGEYFFAEVGGSAIGPVGFESEYHRN